MVIKTNNIQIYHLTRTSNLTSSLVPSCLCGNFERKGSKHLIEWYQIQTGLVGL